MRDLQLDRIKALCSRVDCNVFGHQFMISIKRDVKDSFNGRIFIQLRYNAHCSKTGKVENWSSRKWYLSDHMIDDEIVKTVYLAFETAVKHEILEGFKVDGKILFNPHVYFEALLQVSSEEVTRTNVT